jgi:hypothetical protein
MSNFIIEFEEVVKQTQGLLSDNPEWIERYSVYADGINKNLETIKEKKSKFNQWAPLYLYMNVTEAKGSTKFSIRYLGQDVAKIKVFEDKIIVSSMDFSKNNLRDFECSIELSDADWRSKEATSFRKHFIAYGKRTSNSHKKNEEHRIESLLLTEFSKKDSKTKLMCNIQPVKMAGITRFQMPTPLGASKVDNLKYSGVSGGGIDILARIGKSRGTKLCVLEVKDENGKNEPPAKAIKQGIVYATFLLGLLRSKGGNKWWKLFGFSRDLPKSISIAVACVMPPDIKDTTFANNEIAIGEDKLILHYVYFYESDHQLLGLETSMSECKIK